MDHLTIKEMILIALDDLGSDWEVAPYAACQDGIAAAIGRTRPHVALEVNRLVRDGALTAELAHVETCPSKRVAYRITPIGRERARLVRSFVERGYLKPIVPFKQIARPTNTEKIAELERRIAALEARGNPL